MEHINTVCVRNIDRLLVKYRENINTVCVRNMDRLLCEIQQTYTYSMFTKYGPFILSPGGISTNE
jgi:hypothetical protein